MRTWYGVTLNASGCVSSLDMDGELAIDRFGGEGNNLNGSIPDALWDLTDLEMLSLVRNRNLSGSISSKIGNMTKLTRFFIAGSLTGTIPEEIGNLTRLTHLTINSNHGITGSVPTSFRNLVNLKDLFLGRNQLTQLPDLGTLVNIEQLDISENQFSGSLPLWVVNFNKMFNFFAYQNLSLIHI